MFKKENNVVINGGDFWWEIIVAAYIWRREKGARKLQSIEHVLYVELEIHVKNDNIHNVEVLYQEIKNIVL